MLLAHAGAADEGMAIAMLIGGAWLAWIGVTRLRHRGFERVPVPAAVGLVVVAVGVVVASAVVPRAVFGPTPAPSAGPRIASTATLAFREPADGATLGSDEVRVVLDLQGGTVLDGGTGPVAPDTGHIHLSVDGSLVSMTYGTVQVVDLRPYGAGMHTLEAAFVAADHLPFDPPVVASITFERSAP
jgi:hypothetical protein